jgi:hypothetical protein
MTQYERWERQLFGLLNGLDAQVRRRAVAGMPPFQREAGVFFRDVGNRLVFELEFEGTSYE